MASDEHPRYLLFPNVICVVTSVIVLALLVACFLRKKRGRHGDSSGANVEVVQQKQQPDGSHNVPSTSSPVDPKTGHEFEVFLSFRGSDNRKTFTDYLYHSLTDAGIRTFRDNEELRVGEEIGPELMKSIKQSKIAIPIFSKGYASSKWCLKEVEEMVKCMKETRQLIMPVFLDVTPDQVQHQTGSFADPFAQHEKRFRAEMVRGWRHALKEVVKLKGLELNTVANGNQGEFIKFIVARVIRQLKKSYLEVKNFLVGIEDRAGELIKELEVGTDDIRVIGVWGMGGIGKTTIAKFVYNKIVDNFTSSSFLSNIRETSKNLRGLEHLQSKLASDILKREPEDYANVDEGISVLKERLCNKKALILFDDVDHINQLKNLAGDVKWFGRGSRIIITTREKEVLNQYQVQDLHEVAVLDEHQALELLCHHALGEKLPRADLVELAWDIVNLTGRLPLALEVIGSFLSVYGGRKVMWESTVEKLKIKPDMNVQDKLKISYESLEREQKEIFLDIACFFIGMDVRIVIPMWKDAKLFPEVGIEILLLKELIKIEKDNIILMHDQLRDLGRYIVEQENFKEMGWRSRLWHSEDAVSVLVGQQGTSKVEAIKLDRHHPFVEQQEGVNEEMFKNLPCLKFLELDGVRVNGNFQHVFHRLRWLGWHRENETPSVKLVPDNLVVLDLSQSLTTEDWIGGSSIKVGAKLKVLNLRNCRISRTPDFSACPGLEILILESCAELIYVDPSIGLLKNLILLDMRKCLRLKELPKELGSMESLVEFLIDYTEVEEVPISGGMKKLEMLSANCCKYLREIPALIGSLMNLKILHLVGCTSLRALPELPYGLISLKIAAESKLTFLDLVNLAQLRELRLSLSRDSRIKEGCLSSLRELESLILESVWISTLPEEMGSFLHLEAILICDCVELNYIPKLPPSLSVLSIMSCDSLWRLQVSNLKNLSKLEVDSCPRIKEIEGLGNLLSLKTLSIEDCPLNELEGLERLESLNRVRLISSRVKRLPDLSKLKNLRYLDVSNNSELDEIRGLNSLKELKELVMAGCASLKLLPEVPSRLEILSLVDCKQVSQVEAVAELTSLRHLDLIGCEALKNLPNLSKLQRLEYLNMGWCRHIEEIPGLEELSNLQRLYARECDALKLPDLSKLKSNGLVIITKSVE